MPFTPPPPWSNGSTFRKSMVRTFGHLAAYRLSPLEELADEIAVGTRLFVRATGDINRPDLPKDPQELVAIYALASLMRTAAIHPEWVLPLGLRRMYSAGELSFDRSQTPQRNEALRQFTRSYRHLDMELNVRLGDMRGALRRESLVPVADECANELLARATEERDDAYGLAVNWDGTRYEDFDIGGQLHAQHEYMLASALSFLEAAQLLDEQRDLETESSIDAGSVNNPRDRKRRSARAERYESMLDTSISARNHGTPKQDL